MRTEPTDNKHQTLGRILAAGLIPNLIPDALDPVRLADAARRAGIRAIEISCRRADTLRVLADLKRQFPDMPFWRIQPDRGRALL